MVMMMMMVVVVLSRTFNRASTSYIQINGSVSGSVILQVISETRSGTVNMIMTMTVAMPPIRWLIPPGFRIVVHPCVKIVLRCQNAINETIVAAQ